MEEEKPYVFRSGQITKLEVQKKNPARVSVYVDGEFALGVYGDVVLEYGLAVGRQVSAEYLEQVKKSDVLMSAKTRALAYLAHRARTKHEVRNKLKRSGVDDETSDRVLKRLDELGYLDDKSYARDYVRSRINNRGYGPQRIRSELVRRGIAPELADTAVEEGFAELDLLDAARSHAQKKWSTLRREPDPGKRRRKLVGYLLRRGFDYETVYRVVEECERGN